MINPDEIKLLKQALDTLSEGFSDLPEFTPEFDSAAAADVLQTVAQRMQDNYPYYHPQYAGQMLKPPHAIARLAYALSLWINPNNHALDGSLASSPMEKESVAAIAELYGWSESLGHLTGGGTMANLEALWVAGQLHPGKRVIASNQAHYTHSRISDVLGLEFSAIDVDDCGRLRIEALESELRRGDVGTVVATIGNTGLGAVDPLPSILELARKHGARVHADAAYGGYFGLANNLGEPARHAYDALGMVDSIVIDPHKHGLQPYGCGCILFRDPSVGRFYQHDSPYTYFTSADLHLGEISLECSRPGASAVALWATQQLFPMHPGAQFSQWMTDYLTAARALWLALENSRQFEPLMPPELDIVVYALAAPDTASASGLARKVFSLAAERGLHLALINLPSNLIAGHAPDIVVNSPTTTCLRSVMMKPEHKDWVPEIVAILEESATLATSADI